MKIGNRTFDFEAGQGAIMGILNVTPDSFSDGGEWNSVEAALTHVAQMIDEGADLIDIGAESTRPGHEQISVDEELSRLLPVLEAVRSRFDIPISVDCYRAATAKEAIRAGADLINDIWGLTYDPEMAALVARSSLPVCIMHNRKNELYTDFVPNWLDDVRAQLAIAKGAGIAPEQIILDPGVGFAKDRKEDALAIRHLDELRALGYPVLLGTSRKRLLGEVLNVPAKERDLGTAATTVYGYCRGARIFRVHNVKANRQALDVAMALENA